ncbi:MAG: hypothetical protein QM756_08400 [Polyangiaceae bacterium]
MDLPSAESWTYRLLALASLQQTIELLALRREFADDGMFSWRVLRVEHRSLTWPLRLLFGLLLPDRSFVASLWLRLALGGLLFWGHGVSALPLCLLHVAGCVRFRGTFNGGSDYMSVQVLLATSFAWALRGVPLAPAALYVYVAVQLVLSYFLAGIAKLRERAWRDGSALGEFLREPRFATPSGLAEVAEPAALGRPLCWLVVGFECAFPLALLSPRLAVAFMSMGCLFHFAIALAFGLNRFFWAWLAAYPSLLFASTLVHW